MTNIDEITDEFWNHKLDPERAKNLAMLLPMPALLDMLAAVEHRRFVHAQTVRNYEFFDLPKDQAIDALLSSIASEEELWKHIEARGYKVPDAYDDLMNIPLSTAIEI